MKRALLTILLLALVAPCLSAQEKTDAERWRSMPILLKQTLLLGFQMGASTASRKILAAYQDMLAEQGGRMSEYRTAGTPGRSAEQDDTMKQIAAMDAFFRRPENAKASMWDAMFEILFGNAESAQ